MNYNDLIAQADLQNCDSRDSACVANNVAKQAAVEDYWVQHMATGVPAGTVLSFADLTPAQVTDFYNPSNIANGGNVVDSQHILTVTNNPSATVPPVQPSGSWQPMVKFIASRNGVYVPSNGVLIPGDDWTVQISGAKPNSSVVVMGGKGGGSATANMGNTTGDGVFGVSGKITADQVGPWSEAWSAGGMNAGAFSFTVGVPSSSTAANTNNANSTTNTTNSTSTDLNIPGTAVANIFGLFGDSSPTLIDAIPVHEYTLMGLVGGAIVLMLMLGGRRR